jgi:hypothetical protein
MIFLLFWPALSTARSLHTMGRQRLRAARQQHVPRKVITGHAAAAENRNEFALPIFDPFRPGVEVWSGSKAPV